MNINRKCIVIFILQFLLQNISSQNVYEISGGENKIKEYISDIYFTGNDVYVLYNKIWKNKQVKGFKVNYNLHVFSINQNKNPIDLNKPILKFKRENGGYNDIIVKDNQLTVFGNYAEISNVMKCDLVGNIVNEMVINKTNCGVQDFIGFTKSGNSVFKDWCAQEIYLLSETKEVVAKYQLENRELYHNVEFAEERLLSYFTVEDPTFINIELVEFDIENNNSIKKTIKPIKRTPSIKSKGFKKYGSKYVFTELDSINTYYRLYSISDDTLRQENFIVIDNEKPMFLLGVDNNFLIFLHSIVEYEDRSQSIPKVVENNLLLIKSSEDFFNLKEGVNHFGLQLEGVYTHYVIPNSGKLHILTEYAKNPKKLGLKTLVYEY